MANVSGAARGSLLAAVLCAAAGGTALADTAAGTDPVALWQQSLAAQRFQDMQADATLTTVLQTGDEVTLRFKMLAVLQPDGINRMLLARVSDGGALKDTSFLAVERPQAHDDLWLYLPTIHSPRRMVSSNLGDSFLGSEFRFGDLLQSEPADYEVTLRGDEVLDGQPCTIIEIVPRTPRLARDTGLGRQVLWLRRDNHVERRIEQYDRTGALLKTIDLPRLFTDPATGKVLPSERRVKNAKSGVTSVALFDNVRVNRGVSADLFSPARLSDRTW